MLSKVMKRGLMRAPKMSAVVKPGNHVCFCGCGSMNSCNKGVMAFSKRNFQGHLGLDSNADLVPVDYKAADQVSMWKDVKAKQENSLVLKSNDEIE